MTSGLLTVAGFVVMTLLVVIWHLRRNAGEGTTRCPACGGNVPAGAAHCPGCDVPLQVFEVASARPVRSQAAETSAVADEAPHAIVRADSCVGCGTCVAACPEDGAIRLENKLAIVERERCKGHGTCVEACPVGGIVLGTGDMVHRVTVPDVRDNFHTALRGVYIVGELGGRGLIKNAINEGRVAVEGIARELSRQGPHRQVEGVADLVIVGSGPAGLSAALTARREKLHAVVLEQGTISDSIRKYPRRKLLLAEPVGIPLYGDLWVADATKETLLSVWEATIAEQQLDIRPHCRVERIERRHGDLLHVSGDGFAVVARRVVLAMGRRGTPRRLGVPGEDLDKVYYDIVEMEQFAKRRVLVVGGGDSAIESFVGLTNQPDTEVSLSYRRERFDRVKPRNMTHLQQVVEQGRGRVLLQSQVVRIEPESVDLDMQGKIFRLPNDDVIVRIGGEPPTRFLESLGIHMVTKEIPLVEAKAGVGDEAM
jgi:thioredoxin reductase/Pyruvate/2-oxoacid:ferredoxin oxidoreductase delta subunit